MALAARPYARKIKEILQQLSTQEKDNVNALFQAREKLNMLRLLPSPPTEVCVAHSIPIFSAQRLNY